MRWLVALVIFASATLIACIAADKKWQARPDHIKLTCAIDTKHKLDHCEGAFTLSTDSYSDDGKFVLERNLK